MKDAVYFGCFIMKDYESIGQDTAVRLYSVNHRDTLSVGHFL